LEKEQTVTQQTPIDQLKRFGITLPFFDGVVQLKTQVAVVVICKGNRSITSHTDQQPR
jgi:hypothetical protein